jgi:hypothetical protein
MKELNQYLSGASAVMKGFLTILRGVPQGRETPGREPEDARNDSTANASGRIFQGMPDPRIH